MTMREKVAAEAALKAMGKTAVVAGTAAATVMAARAAVRAGRRRQGRTP